jgi:hypothetical protein
MKTRAFLAVAATILACAVLIGIRPSMVPAQDKEPKAAAPPKWEYKQVESPTAADLTKLGEEGWEIVTVLGGQPYVKDSKVFGPAAGGPQPVGPVAPLISTRFNTIEYGKLVFVLKRPK